MVPQPVARPTDPLTALIAELADAWPDPLAEVERLHAKCREAYLDGCRYGWRVGYEQAERNMARRWDKIAGPVARGGIASAELKARRGHVCCRPCRLAGHREGCADCEDRDRETFSQPHPADRGPAEIFARARASWASFGLPEPGMVHFSGPAVHHHRCTQACYAYKPGWYTAGQAIAILATLPGNYAEVIASLRADMKTPERRAAA
jgi:hypothetical protein